MTTATAERPKEIRIGLIKAVIFRNETENGDRYNTTVKRIYRLPEEKRNGPNDNGWRESESLGRDDLPVAEKVMHEAFTWIHSQNGTNDEA